MTKYKRKNDTNKLNSYLRHDEKLLWTGKPNPMRLLTNQDLFMIPFSLIWCGIMYSVFLGAIVAGGVQALFMLFVPHLWVAIWLIPGRFIYGYYNRRHTTYAVTNQRLIIHNSTIRGSFKSYNLRQLPEITIYARQNNTGTIKFSLSTKSRNQAHDPSGTDFFDIVDVWDVYHLIQKLQHETSIKTGEESLYYDHKQKPPTAYH